ncbi:hypothetical protein Rhopal_001895-T1 [Rhodotorula paludigena]|uniref:F-box domain-containing protein n=1 Tax=Rhodotorula paludigena TaxID=86838 RepID=A0AAV5GIA5_9BASI|nr:hypothetical protein Rhopal_001895-T1 [Rhodotorula paludigena]
MALPDELLRCVFLHVFKEVHDEQTMRLMETSPRYGRFNRFWQLTPERPAGVLAPTSCILLNRRVYAVSKSAWRTSYVLHVSCKVQQDVKGVKELLLAPAQGIDWYASRYDREQKSPPELQLDLARFQNIHTLRFIYREMIPKAFTDALAQLPHLHTLHFVQDEGYRMCTEDTTFSLATATRSLRVLVMDGFYSTTKALFPRGLPPLEELFLIEQGLYSHIPWHLVPVVHLFTTKGYFRDTNIMHEPDARYYEEAVPDLLEVLQDGPSLVRLDFLEVLSIEAWDTIELCMPHVVHILLDEQCTGVSWMQDSCNHLEIPPFLAHFPSLETLEMAGFSLLHPAEAPVRSRRGTPSTSSPSEGPAVDESAAALDPAELADPAQLAAGRSRLADLLRWLAA